MKYLFFKIACAIFLFSEVSAQQLVVPANLYGIRNPGKEIDKFCSSCTKFMETLPKEVGYGLSVDPNNDVYFVFTDVDYFNKLFASPTDGLAVDIILRDQYSCKGPTKTSGSWLYRGYLPKPVYQAELKANKTVTKEGYVYVKLFKLPKQFLNKEIELNLILLKNKYFCWYNTFYNLESGHWGLLDMGMYMDTLSEQSLKEKSNVLGKRLNFEVPFAKDKAEYAAKDIKPLYDSLKLTNFDIKSISIRAYSSVEGTTERNLQLQQKRAESIVKALQTLQSVQLDSIKTEIIVSENWVEFYEDIIDGKFSDMSGLSKDEIKLRLNTDPHSPDIFRINGPLSNFDPFYAAFNVQPGDSMYVKPENRLHIW
ncbi:MAG: M13-type metalloendopeptidase [Cytophagaceae bacterium]